MLEKGTEKISSEMTLTLKLITLQLFIPFSFLSSFPYFGLHCLPLMVITMFFKPLHSNIDLLLINVPAVYNISAWFSPPAASTPPFQVHFTWSNRQLQKQPHLHCTSQEKQSKTKTFLTEDTVPIWIGDTKIKLQPSYNCTCFLIPHSELKLRHRASN